MENPQLTRKTMTWNETHNGKQIGNTKKTTQNNTEGHHYHHWMSPQRLATPTNQLWSESPKSAWDTIHCNCSGEITTRVIQFAPIKKKEIVSEIRLLLWKSQIPPGLHKNTQIQRPLEFNLTNGLLFLDQHDQFQKGNWQGWSQSPIVSYIYAGKISTNDFGKSPFWGDSNEVASQNHIRVLKGWGFTHYTYSAHMQEKRDAKLNIWFTRACMGFQPSLFLSPPKPPTTSDLRPIPLAFFWKTQTSGGCNSSIPFVSSLSALGWGPCPSKQQLSKPCEVANIARKSHQYT